MLKSLLLRSHSSLPKPFCFPLPPFSLLSSFPCCFFYLSISVRFCSFSLLPFSSLSFLCLPFPSLPPFLSPPLLSFLFPFLPLPSLSFDHYPLAEQLLSPNPAISFLNSNLFLYTFRVCIPNNPVNNLLIFLV